MCVTVTQPLICVLFTLSVGVVCFFCVVTMLVTKRGDSVSWFVMRMKEHVVFHVSQNESVK